MKKFIIKDNMAGFEDEHGNFSPTKEGDTLPDGYLFSNLKKHNLFKRDARCGTKFIKKHENLNWVQS